MLVFDMLKLVWTQIRDTDSTKHDFYLSNQTLNDY